MALTKRFICVENHEHKRNKVDDNDTILMQKRKITRFDGSVIEVDEPIQEKAGEFVKLFLADERAAGVTVSENLISLRLMDPEDWGHFVEGQVYDLTF